MQVHPTQLIPNCVLMVDVFGKTNQPIVPNKTVLTETHIKVLQSFLVKEVEVAPKLANGLPFQPEVFEKKVTTKTIKTIPFLEQYHQTISSYKKLFIRWQSGTPMDIQTVRNLIIPLLERAEEAQADVFLLGNHSAKPDYFYHHSVTTSLLTALLAKRLGKKEWLQISLAAFLADSGTAKIKRSLVEKKGLYTDPEYTEIKMHPTFSYRFVEKCPSLTREAKLAVLQHHEQLDGSGYPMGVTEEKIHSFAKIIAIADTYHAMTSDRFYQNRRAFLQVIAVMHTLKNKQFDETMLHVFFTCIKEALLGKKVNLSDKRTAKIISLQLGKETKITVQVDSSGEQISLIDENQLTIKSIVD